MIIGSRINGKESNLLQTAPFKEVFVTNNNLSLLEVFKIAEANLKVDTSIVNEVNQEGQVINPNVNMNVNGGQQLMPNEVVPMEDAPAKTIEETIAPPTVEEINALRKIISDTSNKLIEISNSVTELNDKLDSLNQSLQVSLDGFSNDRPENAISSQMDNETSIKM